MNVQDFVRNHQEFLNFDLSNWYETILGLELRGIVKQHFGVMHLTGDV